ncbi:MAG: methyltransferase regulatory domain-containing protein [Synechococcus sp.]
MAQATARARDLGLTNVTFAAADLRHFASGRPEHGPCRSWPAEFDLVIAHGVASWVGAHTREALVQAAGHCLVPGGLFYCSYNTYPGWLSRSPLQMLGLELGLRSGHNTSEESLQQAASWLGELLDPEAGGAPLGAQLPLLAGALEGVEKASSSYLMGDYHATHQPLYVGPFHRTCAEVGLAHVGTANLPELFPQMLDPRRAAWVAQAADPSVCEILLDLAINQTFRRDLFARGVVPPNPAEHRAELAALPLVLRRESLRTREEFPSSLGTMAIDAPILEAMHAFLADGPRTLGELAAEALQGAAPRDLLPQLALLLNDNLLGADPLAALAAGSQPELQAAGAAEVAVFNQQLANLASLGKGAGGLLAPGLRLPVPLEDVQILLAQVEGLGLGDAERLQMVWLGMQMAGIAPLDPQGEPIRNDEAVLVLLAQIWESFQANGMEDLRRLGIC